MGNNRLIMLKKTHFDDVLNFMQGFLYRNMFPVINSLWVFVSKFTIYVFLSIIGYFFSFSGNRCLEENDSGACLDTNFYELKEKQSSDYVDHGNCEGGENSDAMVANTSKYEFLYRKGISGFIEEPKAESYTVHELYMDSDDSVDSHVEKLELEMEDVLEEQTENSESSMVEKILEIEPKLEKINSIFEYEIEESALRFSFFQKPINPEKFIHGKDTIEEKADNFIEEKAEDSVSEITVKKPGQAIEPEVIFIDEAAEESVENSIVETSLEKPKQGAETEEFSFVADNYITQENISEEHKREKKDGNCHLEEELNKEVKEGEETGKFDVESITFEVLANRVDSRPENIGHEIDEKNTSFSDHEPENLAVSINDSDDEFIELELTSEKQFVMRNIQVGEDLEVERKDDLLESMVSPEKAQEPDLQEEFISNYEEDDDDSEQDDLIERLKMELKLARTGGLSTILEESESPKMDHQLGPLQIDEKYDHKYHIAEIQKVYKSYFAKMRKLDILNSQTMHAISLLQLKHPVRSSTAEESSSPAIKSLLLWLFKQRKPEAGPTTKLIRDMQKDFETVYVGQVCLSWEILHWQYGKVRELLENDSQGIRQYNQVAEEFQLFQVLMQRFLENEPFQGKARVENYVKHRCKLRHLLQVPVIKDDCSKYKNGKEDATVSSEMLTDIIEESMHVFWEFLRADKDEANATSKTPQQAQVAPHDPIDLELLMDVRTNLQKKERRLKEIQRSTNCIIKKIQRQNQGNMLDESLFIAQVELRLVSRVLKMLRITTDQLVWCHEKLQKINFSSRKIQLEPCFTLFPC